MDGAGWNSFFSLRLLRSNDVNLDSKEFLHVDLKIQACYILLHTGYVHCPFGSKAIALFDGSNAITLLEGL